MASDSLRSEVDSGGQAGENTPALAARPALWRDRLFWLTLLLTLPAIAPFVLPGYFWGANDARHHVYFLFEYDRLVQDGIWLPRWSPDFAFGYGYPFFNIYGPFSHFIGELLHHFGRLGFTTSIEAVFVLSIVGSAVAMYLCARDWIGRAPAVVAALLYVYLPYHLLNLYVRANLAESMAFVWLPLCLWGVRRALLANEWRGRVRWALVTAVAYGGLMVTSNLVVVLFTPFLGLYLLLLAWVHAAPSDVTLHFGAHLWAAIRRAIAPILGLAAGLGLSAFFWIPAFLEQKYVLQRQWFAGRYDFRGNFVYFRQLFDTHWGFGVSVPGADDAISLQIGLAALVLAFVGILATWRRAGRLRWEIAFLAAAAVVAVFLSLQVAAPLWELPVIGGVLRSAQFPWRWFSVMAPFVALLGGLVMARFDGDALLPANYREERLPPEENAGIGGITLPLIVVAATIILASYPYLRVQITEPVEGPVSLAALMRFQQSSDEMTGSTAWVTEVPRWSPMAQYYVDQAVAGDTVAGAGESVIAPVTTKLDYGNIDYENLAADSVAHNSVMEEVYYLNRSESDQPLIFNQFYYPGWRAWLLDGEHGAKVAELPIVPETTGTLGRMTVAVPPGEGHLLLAYGTTTPRTVGKYITWLTLVLMIVALGATFLVPKRRPVAPLPNETLTSEMLSSERLTGDSIAGEGVASDAMSSDTISRDVGSSETMSSSAISSDSDTTA